MSADSEAQPLLINDADGPHSANISKSKSNRLLILVVCGFLTFASQFGTYLSIPSQTAIFEQIICRNQLQLREPWNAFPNIADNEDFCKSEEVQSELALVIGYKDGLDMIPAILLALPYGILADHWGRRPVILLSILGYILAELWIRLVSEFLQTQMIKRKTLTNSAIWSNVLPLRLVWLSPIWKIIGGGDQVTTALAFVIISDISSEEELSTTLFRLSACSLVAEVLATPCSAYLMTLSPWLPFLLGFGIIFFGFLPSLLVPETLKSANNEPTISDLSSDVLTETNEPQKTTTFQNMVSKLRTLKEATLAIWGDRNVSLIVLAVSACTSVVSPQLINILLQFASKKFKWSISRASLLISVRGIFSSCNFLILMPAWNYVATHFLDMHGKYRDYRTSQGSGLFLILGFIMMAFAPSPGILIAGVIVMSLGTALIMSSRSLATELVSADHVGTLYSVIAIFSAISTLIASPLMAYLFQIGMHMGEAWMGLPLLQGAMLSLISTVAICRVRLGVPSYTLIQTDERAVNDRTPLLDPS